MNNEDLKKAHKNFVIHVMEELKKEPVSMVTPEILVAIQKNMELICNDYKNPLLMN